MPGAQLPTFKGDRRRQLVVAGLRVTEIDYTAAMRGWHGGVGGLRFRFPVRGYYRETMRGVERRIGTANVSFRGLDDMHYVSFGPGGSRLVLVLFSDSWRGHGAYDLLANQEPDLDEAWSSLLIWKLYAAFTADDHGGALDVELLAHEFVDRAVDRARARAAPSAPWVRRMRERLHEDPDASMTLRDVAADADAHPTYAARCFRAAHGCSVGEYRRRAQLSRACALLATGAELADVAASTGFSDQAHFTRVFRRWMGTTPGRWRRSASGSGRS